MATSSGLFLATIYDQSQLVERKHVARYWLINTAATAVPLSTHPSPLVITTKLAAAILAGGLFGGSVLPAQYCPCEPSPHPHRQESNRNCLSIRYSMLSWQTLRNENSKDISSVTVSTLLQNQRRENLHNEQYVTPHMLTVTHQRLDKLWYTRGQLQHFWHFKKKSKMKEILKENVNESL